LREITDEMLLVEISI